MNIEATLFNNELLQFQRGLPAEYKGPILKGATVLYAKNNVVDLTVQEIRNEDYSIRFTIAKFLKSVVAISNITVHGLYSNFMVKNNLRKEIKSIGKLHLRQDQYVGFMTEPSTCKAKFEKDIEYRAIDLFYSPTLLQELLPFFPDLKDFAQARPSAVLEGKPCWTLPSMQEITHQLLNCPYDEETCRFYFDLKVRELLYQILENTYKRKAAAFYFTPFEIARVHEVRNILETYIPHKPPTLKILSKQVALNQFKLKTGFKQYFQVGIFEWLMERKMQRAKELLLTTNKPIKDICTMVGYPRTTNFITAFRRRFGMPPGALRRQ